MFKFVSKIWTKKSPSHDYIIKVNYKTVMRAQHWIQYIYSMMSLKHNMIYLLGTVLALICLYYTMLAWHDTDLPMDT